MTDLAEWTRSADLDALREWIEQTGTLDIAEDIARLEPDERALTFRLLPRDRALTVFEALDPVHQQDVLEALRDERVVQIMEALDPDDRARLFEEMPAKVVRRVLAGLSPLERSYTAALLGYPEDSAGRIMTPEFVLLRASMTAADALAKIRRTPSEPETLTMMPVGDDQRRLLGVVRLARLVQAPPSRAVSELVEEETYRVSAFDDQEAAARLVAEADLLSLPVVDSEDRVVGVITVDDAMRILEEEVTEDLHLAGGTEPLGRPYFSVTVRQLAAKRVVWLLALVAAATLTVNVLGYFEDTLASVVTLALFIPLLTGTGGNTGAQASTVVIRAMALDEVRLADLPRVVWREARVGLVLGSMLAVIGFLPVSIFFGTDLATVVSLTLLAVCAWATFAGSMLPLLAKRVGVDPAVMSAPLITTLVDATGLLMYFLIARAILGI
ncbi:MAG: magnesium transporter [Acidimicrobiia bacterium]|jgi:magnesium transporter